MLFRNLCEDQASLFDVDTLLHQGVDDAFFVFRISDLSAEVLVHHLHETEDIFVSEGSVDTHDLVGIFQEGVDFTSTNGATLVRVVLFEDLSDEAQLLSEFRSSHFVFSSLDGSLDGFSSDGSVDTGPQANVSFSDSLEIFLGDFTVSVGIEDSSVSSNVELSGDEDSTEGLVSVDLGSGDFVVFQGSAGVGVISLHEVSGDLSGQRGDFRSDGDGLGGSHRKGCLKKTKNK